MKTKNNSKNGANKIKSFSPNFLAEVIITHRAMLFLRLLMLKPTPYKC